MTTIREQLDSILLFHKQNENTPIYTIDGGTDIMQAIGNEMSKVSPFRDRLKLNNDLLKARYRKLIDDKLIYPITDNQQKVRLTTDGEFFLEEGGYQEQARILNAERKRITDVETNQRETSRQMVALTRILAITSGIPALYYLTKGILWLLSHFHCF